MASSHHQSNRTALGKPTPSKWDDAEKWLVNQPKVSPRNSNAEDRRLIGPGPSEEETEEKEKNVVNSPVLSVRPICLRDMGTEMTPIASQEPSRAATPVRATSPISPRLSTPVRSVEFKTVQGFSVEETKQFDEDRDVISPTNNLSPLELRAMEWEEAERVKNMTRFKREEAKIQAWENHEKRKAEMENRKVEVKAERLKSRAQEKCNATIAATKRMAEEKRANAEAKLQEEGMKTSERADCMRRNGKVPSSSCFWFDWFSLCG